MPQPMQNLEDSLDPTTTMNKALALIAKAFKLNTIPTNNNQGSSLIPRNSQIAQPDMNTSQDIKMQMVDDNVGNQVRQNEVQNIGNRVIQNAVQNPGVQNFENMNGLSVVSEIANQYGNGNVVTTPAEGNGNGINGNPIRCYNCRGEGHYASNCTVKSRKRDAAYLQQQLQIAQEEEAGIQSTQEEFEFMTTADAHEETERVKVNCTSEDTLQQASTSGTQSDNAPVYDSDGSTEFEENFENCIIKKEKEYAVLWNNWYTKCEECKYDKILYDKAYNDMQQKIERLQAQLGDLKGKSSASRVDNFVPNKHVKPSIRTKSITISQPHVITKNEVNSKTNGFSPKDSKSTTRTRRPQPRNNPKSDKVPFKSKSSCLSNKLEKIEENHRSLQSSNHPDHTSSECNNIKLAIQNEKSEVICATCKQCLITANHDDCVLQYVNGMKSRKKNQSANVSKSANQRKHKPRVWKPKKVGSKERLASPKPSTPRSCLRWSPTGRMFDLKGKIIATSESECQPDCSKGCQTWLDTLLIPLLSEYKPKDKENHGDNECDSC
ncbi:crossover junction endonuclease EME1B-like protein [Tanacetum coccineum]